MYPFIHKGFRISRHIIATKMYGNLITLVLPEGKSKNTFTYIALLRQRLITHLAYYSGFSPVFVHQFHLIALLPLKMPGTLEAKYYEIIIFLWHIIF